MSRRFLAGLIDGAAILGLSALAFFLPLLLRGWVLPMWGVLAVIVGYSILPLAFFKQTFGLRAVGLELVTATGHEVDLANVAFRELLGRGLFPLAFLYTVLLGTIAQLLRIAALGFPKGLFFLFFIVCGLAVLAALVGQLYGLGRPDGRTAADFMTKSFVVVAPARPLPEDEDEREELRATTRRRVRNVALVEVGLALAVLAGPLVLTARVGESPAQRTARIKRQGVEQRFKADPANATLAAELRSALFRAGLDEAAADVLQRHRAAVGKRDEGREATLRALLAKQPEDERTASSLIELLENQERLDDAAAVYRAWLGPSPTPGKRAGFGNWLASVGRSDAAVVELSSALAQEPLLPMGHTLLGIALARQGHDDEARDALVLALLDDPDDEDAQDALAQVDERLPPMDPARKKTLEQRHAAWTLDAGVAPVNPASP